MHYVDRKKYKNAPTKLLAEYHKSEQTKWLDYKAGKASKPASKWNNDKIRIPLQELFLCNCGYCGTFTDIGHDAEVDHFFPVAKDTAAAFIYNWENYIWSCPMCNRKKSNHLELLNPCEFADVEHLYFNKHSGKYLLFKKANSDIREKYNNTVSFTYINGKNKPKKRKRMVDDLEDKLRALKIKFDNYMTVKSSKRPSISIIREVIGAKNRIVQEIDSADFLLLIKETIENYDYTYSLYNAELKQYIKEKILKKIKHIC